MFDDTRLALCDVCGPLNDLTEKLSDVRKGTVWLAGLKRFLRKENPWENLSRRFSVWRTIKIGTGIPTGDDFSRILRAEEKEVCEGVIEILRNADFTVVNREMELDLVCLSAKDLGFSYNPTLREVVAVAREARLLHCPAEVGPQLRRQYKDQPKGERLLVIMKPIPCLLGHPCMFYVGHDSEDMWPLPRCDKPWLSTMGNMRDYAELQADQKLVFVSVSP
jgi:hypothetical protein